MVEEGNEAYYDGNQAKALLKYEEAMLVDPENGAANHAYSVLLWNSKYANTGVISAVDYGKCIAASSTAATPA